LHFGSNTLPSGAANSLAGVIQTLGSAAISAKGLIHRQIGVVKHFNSVTRTNSGAAFLFFIGL